MAKRKIQIAGAGLSGAVIARQLAEANYEVTVFEARDHVAGNCHTERDAETGIMVHRYGPHIFHTADNEVWAYMCRFGRFQPYRHRVWTTVGGLVYPLPISLATINQFFGQSYSPAEAQAFIKGRCENIPEPANFEEQALSMVGRELYEAFFRGYTQKQWGRPPSDLPASILKRLPLRFNYDDGYFNHPVQAMPEDGYTVIVEAILDHPGITVHLSSLLEPAARDPDAHLFWSGPLDAYFGNSMGHLGYRTLDFENNRAKGDVQGCPVMNYGDVEVPYTRITEHKHFMPWEDHAGSLVSIETSRFCEAGDIPYYPIRLAQEKDMLRQYTRAAKMERSVTFLGRLGTYRYLDMDVCVREALDMASAFIAAEARGDTPPIFSMEPIAT